MLYNFKCFKILLKKIIKYKKLYISKKLLNFKKLKWKIIIESIKQFYIISKYKQYKIIDNLKINLTFFVSKVNFYKNLYKNNFLYLNQIKYLYFFNNKYKEILLKNKTIIQNFENSISFILYKCKFFISVNSVLHYIKNNNIFINNILLKNYLFIIKTGDIIKINVKLIKYKYFLINVLKWPIFFFNIVVNYKIKELICITHFYNFTIKNGFLINLKILL